MPGRHRDGAVLGAALVGVACLLVAAAVAAGAAAARRGARCHGAIARWHCAVGYSVRSGSHSEAVVTLCIRRRGVGVRAIRGRNHHALHRRNRAGAGYAVGVALDPHAVAKLRQYFVVAGVRVGHWRQCRRRGWEDRQRGGWQRWQQWRARHNRSVGVDTVHCLRHLSRANQRAGCHTTDSQHLIIAHWCATRARQADPIIGQCHR